MTRILAELPRDDDGQPYGQAADIAGLLTSPDRRLTAARIRDWARRSRCPGDPLYGMLPAVQLPGERTGTTWYRLADVARVEVATRRE